ncbi:MAG: hypothetical protein AAF603_08265, partial [Pseudomonadota bacterium]
MTEISSISPSTAPMGARGRSFISSDKAPSSWTTSAEDGAETFQEHDDLADYDLQADVVHDEGALSDEMNDLP